MNITDWQKLETLLRDNENYSHDLVKDVFRLVALSEHQAEQMESLGTDLAAMLDVTKG
jgi:hypothetical protein